MRNFILYLFFLLITPCIIACSHDNAHDNVAIQKKDSSAIIHYDSTNNDNNKKNYINDNSNKDSVIYQDTTFYKKVIIAINHQDASIIEKEIYIVNHQDTFYLEKKKRILKNFDSISIDNVRVEKSFQMINEVGSSFQGMAVWEDYLFQCHHSNNGIDVYDLTNNSLAFTINKKKEGTVHCNNVDFGNQYYSENDSFPLLYLEHKGGYHKTSVYRIIKNDSVCTAVKVQTIDFTDFSSCITNNNLDKGLMYVSGGSPLSITAVEIPDFKLGNITIPGVSSISYLETFTPNYPTYKVCQDGTIYKNKLFQLRGGAGTGELAIINLETHNLIYIIDFNEIGISGEPEGIAWYKDHLLISNLYGQVYNLYFVK